MTQPGPGRIVLLVTSPRTAPGQLTWPAWDQLRAAGSVLAADPDPQWVVALAEAGITIEDVAHLPVAQRAGRLLEAVTPSSGAVSPDGPGALVVWFGSADGDPGLTDALAEHLARRAVAATPPEVELVMGSHDLPGARLLDLVAVMDRLRSPGGCPWDAEQTHLSLVPYLLEETHELIEAIEALTGVADRAHLTEELGDLLLQVIFHARMAQDDDQAPFTIDDVAAGIVAKLVRRHPHVFGDVSVSGPGEVIANWEQIKAEEKQREGVFDGIPASLPALARAQKMLGRLGADAAPGAWEAAAQGDPIAATLLGAVRQAQAAGVDAESVLRLALARLTG